MIKKLIRILVVIILLFSFCSFSACNNVSLSEYKDIKITELQEYAASKGQGNYSTDNWEIICSFVTDGKAAIEKAESKSLADTAFDDAKNEIDKVKNEAKLLEEYKLIKSAELQGYADGKGQSNYSIDNWDIICSLVAYGEAVIGAAESKSLVNKAFNVLKDEIDKVNEKTNLEIDRLFSLRDAYDHGLLTLDNLQSIADFYNNGTVSDAELSDELQNKIKEAYLKQLNVPQAIIDEYPDGIHILNYYGTYGNAIVIYLTDSYIPKDLQPKDYNINGIVFYNYIYCICIWYSAQS